MSVWKIKILSAHFPKKTRFHSGILIVNERRRRQEFFYFYLHRSFITNWRGRIRRGILLLRILLRSSWDRIWKFTNYSTAQFAQTNDLPAHFLLARARALARLFPLAQQNNVEVCRNWESCVVCIVRCIAWKERWCWGKTLSEISANNEKWGAGGAAASCCSE